jgi:hypothetical protein
MEQSYKLEMEVHADVDFDKVRHWLDSALDTKVTVHFFISGHAGNYAGLDAIDGTLFISDQSTISAEDLIGYLPVPNELIKTLKVTPST